MKSVLTMERTWIAHSQSRKLSYYNTVFVILSDDIFYFLVENRAMSLNTQSFVVYIATRPYVSTLENPYNIPI